MRSTARLRAMLRPAAQRALWPLARTATLQQRWLDVSGGHGRGLVLLWHRVRPEGRTPWSVIRTVTPQQLRAQLSALQAVGDIVPLDEVDEPSHERPRFAVTFDDDDAGHAEHALPVLRDLGVPATFFLSGRWLAGLGPYWWEVLEARVRDEGLAAAARRLGSTAVTIDALAGGLEGDPVRQQRLHQPGGPPPMSEADAEALRTAGMRIGFHTLHHPRLTDVATGQLDVELRAGRDDLAAWLGQPLRELAYPHGRVDRRVVAAASAAGFTTGWTTSHRPVDGSEPPLRRGRWEPGDRDAPGLVIGALRRLALAPADTKSAT